jgi:pSer/pThr/pTyr-binding forkhead associated (FHA) protein
MLAFLLVVDGQDMDLGRSAVVGRGDAGLTIGRSPEAGLRLNDPAASRIHCRVTVVDGKAWVEDAGSSAGTLVNGERVQKQELKPDDLVRVGTTELRFQWSNVDEQPTTGWKGPEG